MSTSADKGFYIKLPPRASGKNAAQSASSTTTAANSNVFSGLAAADQPVGKCWVTFEAYGASIHVRFKSSGAAGTTTTNGRMIKQDTVEDFWLDPSQDTIVDHMTDSGSGTLKWYVSSPPFEGTRQQGTSS